jgi:hypothetical protein
MDKYWIEKAHRYINEHGAFFDVSGIEYSNDDSVAMIQANIAVELPARFLKDNVSDTGIKSTESIKFEFRSDFPLKAPRIILRDDFPRSFPHINPNDSLVIPCIYEGDLSELLQQSEWMNGILNQLVDWMEKAAAGSLLNYKQGWEPMRNDKPAGFIIYDEFKLLEFIKEHPIGSKKIGYEDRNGIIFTDTLCDPKKIKTGSLFVCRSLSNESHKKYVPNSIINLADLYDYAKSIGIPTLKDKVETYDLSNLNEDKMFIILAIKRPCKLIASDCDVEFLNFVVHKSKRRKDKKRVLPDCKVGMLSHIAQASQQLFQKMSGAKPELESSKTIALLGCGSLGSKIGMHLARNGNGPFKCIDNDIFMPHNNARHGLVYPCTINKAALLSIVIFSMSSLQSDIVSDSVLTDDLSASRFVIDSTASLSVRSYMMSEKSIPPVISCGLYGNGQMGVMFVEGNNEQSRLDDLWAYLYWHSLHCVWLRKILFSEQKERVLIGQSCRSHTVVMSDARLSLYASSMSLRIQKIIESGLPNTGEIILIRVNDEYDLSSETLVLSKSMEISSLTKKEWTVRIFESVIKKMERQALASGLNESGGCLIGSVFLAPKSIVITDILPPPPDSVSSPTLFVLGTQGLHAEIKCIEKRTNGKVTYLGTWHSHPGGGGASSTDKDTAKRLLFVRRYEPTVCLIWTPKGLIQV